MLMSDYQTAEIYFQHTIKRCPDTEWSQTAEFEYARAVEGTGQIQQAVQLYMDFSEKYKGTKQAKIAVRAADLLRT
jgi:TolA-binding protein